MNRLESLNQSGSVDVLSVNSKIDLEKSKPQIDYLLNGGFVRSRAEAEKITLMSLRV